MSPMYCLLLGDCEDEMANMPDGCVHLTVTSPPYDNLRTYNGTLTDWSPRKWQDVIAHLYRLTAPGGVVVWIAGDATVKGSETGSSFRQSLYAMDCGFRLHDTMVWNKGGFTAVGALRTRYAPVFEYMFVWAKGNPRVFTPIKDRPNKHAGTPLHGTIRQADGSFRSVSGSNRKTISEMGQRFNIWEIPPQRQRGGHPAPFPERLARDHIVSWSAVGDVVFDPFLGSGTTAVAALSLGRRFVGIERDPSYLAAARRRVAAAVASIAA